MSASFSLAITQRQMLETNYEALFDKYTLDIRECSASDFTIFNFIAAEYIQYMCSMRALANYLTTISKVTAAIEAYSDHNRDKKSSSCGVDLHHLVFVAIQYYPSTQEPNREHWIANYST